jgi:hypothetical protein
VQFFHTNENTLAYYSAGTVVNSGANPTTSEFTATTPAL